MNLDWSSEDIRFRQAVREFLRHNLAAAVSAKVLGLKRLTREDVIGWQRTLHHEGGPSWPREFGGTGWSAIEQHIFDEECNIAGAPPIISFGSRMVGPVIMKFGNPAQQEYFLPRILNGEHWWCQGYSEPGAGSDLASLKTRAERRGNTYIVNGQKTWNTLGHFADWIFCLVRTDSEARPQAGISFLLIDTTRSTFSPMNGSTSPRLDRHGASSRGSSNWRSPGAKAAHDCSTTCASVTGSPKSRSISWLSS